ncbi:MAG: hypothetical protein HKN29_05985 [Rhodothermales bacterium]|nr:hypothetical protein [Rhodothermales bacterium]
MRDSIPTLILFAAFLLVAGCGSSPTEVEETPEPTGAFGPWTIDPVAFRLNLVVDASGGITEDIQASISGTLNLSEDNGRISGSGSCSWSTRRHTPRTAQTIEESGTEQFSVSGTLVETDARFVLTGCAWNQIGYRGTFDGAAYSLAIPAGAEGPLFDEQVWTEATLIDGDDPAALKLVR